MKFLLNTCALATVLLALAAPVRAQVVVRDSPVHTISPDAGDQASDAGPGDLSPPAEPAAVKALVSPKTPPPALTPDETAFFTVLGRRVTDAASAYESYLRRVVAIDPAFSGPSSVQRTVIAGAAYQPLQLQEGLVAYAALIALRNQAFVDGVRAIQNAAFIDGLAASPGQVMQVRGAAEAAADVAGVLRAQGAILAAAGAAITQAAYDIQAQAWSRAPVQDPQGVLDAAKVSAAQPREATVPSKQQLLASLVAAPQIRGLNQGLAGGGAPNVVRGLALAALAIQGRTGDGAEAQYEALLRDASSEDCLNLANLNLNQCLAVAGPHYEDVYCAGRHGVSETGRCVSQAAAGETGLEAAAPPPSQRAELAVRPGPEEAAAYGGASAPPQNRPQAPASRYAQSVIARPAQLQPYSYAQSPPSPAQAQPYAQNGYGAAQAYSQPSSQPQPAQTYRAAPYPQQPYGYTNQPYYPPQQPAYAPPGYYGR